MQGIGPVYFSNVFAKVVLALVGILLIRWLEPAQLALLTLSFSIVMLIAQPLNDLGNRLYIIYPEFGSSSERLVTILLGQLVVVLAVGAVFAVIGPLPHELSILVLPAAMGIIWVELAKTMYQSAQNFHLYLRLEAVRGCIMLGGVLLLGALDPLIRARDVLIIYAVAGFVPGLYVLQRQSTSIEFGALYRRAIALVPRAVVDGPKALGYIVLQSVIAQLDILVLTRVSTSEQLATYGSSLRYYGVLVLALSSVQTVMFPRMREALGNRALREIFHQYNRLVLWFVVAAALCAFAARWAIPLIDGGRYPDAILAFQILCLSATLSFSFGIYAILALNLRLWRLLFRVSSVTFVLCLTLNAVLSARWGAIGAALATLLTHAFFNISMFFATRRSISATEPPPQV
jgi:O-antigen/teichoic acid export membrane protein